MTNQRKSTQQTQKAAKIDEWRGVGSFGTLGLEIVLCIALGFFGGQWLDGKFDTAPYLGGLGFCFGLAAAIKSVMRAHAEMQALAAKEEREQGNPLPIYDARDDERKSDGIVEDGEDEGASAEDDQADADEKDAQEEAKKDGKKNAKRNGKAGEGDR